MEEGHVHEIPWAIDVQATQRCNFDPNFLRNEN